MKIIDINSIPRSRSEKPREAKKIKGEKANKGIRYLIGLLVILLVGASAFWFFHFRKVKNLQAEDDAFQAVYHFEAGDFEKALKGDGIYKGFLEVIEQYPNTTTANLACFYAGIAHMHQKQYNEAINLLNKFKADDFILQGRAWCVMGDAYSEQKKNKEAAVYYMKAARYKPNTIYTPAYLIKAAIAFEADKQYKQARKCYQEIIEKYPNSQYGNGLAMKEASRLSVLS